MGIVWDILGICYQLLGNLGQVLSVYEELLKNSYNDDLIKVVEKRIKQIVDDMFFKYVLIWSLGFCFFLVMKIGRAHV